VYKNKEKPKLNTNSILDELYTNNHIHMASQCSYSLPFENTVKMENTENEDMYIPWQH